MGRPSVRLVIPIEGCLECLKSRSFSDIYRFSRQIRQWLRTAWLAYRLWDRHGCIDLSAAFAYHTLQSIFPILLIALALASRILGRDEGLMDQIESFANQLLPATATPLIETTMRKLYSQRGGAGAFGIIALLITSTNTYLSLQRGADRLWGRSVPATPSLNRKHFPFLFAIRRFILSRVKALALVGVAGLLLVVDQLTSHLQVISAQTWEDLFNRSLPWPLQMTIPVSDFAGLLLSALVSSVVALALLLIIPTRTHPLRALLPGALLTGLAYTGLNALVGRSLISLGARFQAYGVVSGVLVLTLWVWLVGLILYYGIAFSVVVTRRMRGGDPHLIANQRASLQGRR